MTLRRRTGGPDAGWHLKLPRGCRAPGPRCGCRWPPVSRATSRPSWPALVRGAARGRDLIPVARVENDRTVRHLLDEDGRTLIEVADDHVTATRAARTARPSRPHWRELEAEIVEGTREQLAATVDVLMSAGASKASSASKLARAVGYVPAGSRRSKTAGAVVIGALGRQLDQLTTADRGLRDGTSRAPDALHDARSAARRIRAILTVYAPLLEGESVPGAAHGAALVRFGAEHRAGHRGRPPPVDRPTRSRSPRITPAPLGSGWPTPATGG